MSDTDDLAKIVRRAYNSVELEDPSVESIIEILEGLADSYDLTAVETDGEYGQKVKEVEHSVETFAETAAIAIIGLEAGLDHLAINPDQFLIQFGTSEVEILSEAEVEDHE